MNLMKIYYKNKADGGSCVLAIFLEYFHAKCGIIKNGHESIFDSLILTACIMNYEQ